jgi:hypothetical protein
MLSANIHANSRERTRVSQSSVFFLADFLDGELFRRTERTAWNIREILVQPKSFEQQL